MTGDRDEHDIAVENKEIDVGIIGFDGRLGRLRYLLALLPINIFNRVMAVAGFETVGWGGTIALILLETLLVGIAITLMVRRLHDLGKPGTAIWYTTGPLLVAMSILPIVRDADVGSVIAPIAGLIALPLLIWGLAGSIYLLFNRGTVGPNAYGDDPLSMNRRERHRSLFGGSGIGDYLKALGIAVILSTSSVAIALTVKTTPEQEANTQAEAFVSSGDSEEIAPESDADPSATQMFEGAPGDEPRDQISDSLKQVAEQVNAAPDRKVDDVTTLTGMKAEGHHVTYQYRLDLDERVDAGALMTAMKAATIKAWCDDSRQREMLDLGVTVTALYTIGSNVQGYDFGSVDCQVRNP